MAEFHQSAGRTGGSPLRSAALFAAGAAVGWGLTYAFLLVGACAVVPAGLAAALGLRGPWRWAGIGAVTAVGVIWLPAVFR